MKPLQGVLWACALGFVAAGPGSARAAWCNVFQVCCNSCGGGGSVSAYGGGNGCCDPCCPQPVCTTRYVQRCYYQPVTCYQSRSYYEPVTSYRTSYYYEPVTTYRYSCYYDPCTGCSQQVACPQTCYRLRAQCCPVQSWVQRCCQVPVTSYQRSFYWEPVTTCCTPQTPCPAPCAAPCSNGAQGYAPAPPAANPAPSYVPPPSQSNAPPANHSYAPPAVTEQRTNPVPAIPEYTDPARNGGTPPPSYERYYPQPSTGPTMPPAAGAYRPVEPRSPLAPTVPSPVQRPPTVRLDKIVSIPATQLQGQVVRADNLPQGGVQLTFVSADRRGPEESVVADAGGKFRVTLASGGWLVYVKGSDNRPVFHSKLELRENETRQVTLVSR